MFRPGALLPTVAALLLLLLLLSVEATTATTATTYTNPVRGREGADPQIVFSGGYYHLLTTTGDDIAMARAASLDGLRTAPRRVLYAPQPADAGSRCNLWAPEAHRLDGRWYVYYAAGNCQGTNGQRVHVLRGGADPWDDAYAYAGQLTTAWAIDATVLRAGNGNTTTAAAAAAADASADAYLVYSCMPLGESTGPQALCIQALGTDYVSVTGQARVLSWPDQAFEQHGAPVNEGPYALYRGGRVYLTYAASHCTTAAYCVGLLAWDGRSDPTDAGAWAKTSDCVLRTAHGHYGPGHASFFAEGADDEDDQDRRANEEPPLWIVFHATNNSAGACDQSRYSMVQPVTFDTDGRPDFGVPQPLGQEFIAP